MMEMRVNSRISFPEPPGRGIHVNLGRYSTATCFSKYKVAQGLSTLQVHKSYVRFLKKIVLNRIFI